MDREYLDEERAIGMALKSIECAKQLIELPSEYFAPYHQPLLKAFAYQVQHSPDHFKVDRNVFKTFIEQYDLAASPSQTAAYIGVLNRCEMQAVGRSEFPILLERIRSNGEVRAVAAKAKAAKTPEDFAEVTAGLREMGRVEQADKIEAIAAQKFGSPPRRRTLNTVSMSTIEAKPVEWLWPEMIPLGGLTVVAGEGETGKSTLVSELMTRFTNGDAWPDGSTSEAQGEVLYVGVEEDVERVLVPRLLRMGADTTKFYYARGIESEPGKDGKRTMVPWTFKEIDSLRDTLESHRKVKAVVLDPIGVYFGSADSYKDTEVQSLLQPLSKLSQDYGVTVIAIAHLNKGEAKSIRNRILGSVAIVNTARCVLGVVRDQGEGHKSYCGIVKCNYGGKRLSLPFSTAGGEIAYLEPLQTPLESLASTMSGSTGRNADDRDVATQLIRSLLADEREHESREIYDACNKVGVSNSTVLRASTGLGVRVESRGMPRRTYWTLPDDRPF